MVGKYIDLHVHSNCSDGKKTIQEIICMARANNVGVLSLSEHYNMGSYNIARLLAKPDIEIIPSVEIGTSLETFDLSKNHICHIIAYYPSYRLCKLLDKYESSREICVRKTMRKIQQYVPLSYNAVLKYARNKNSIGRFDIAIALHKEGYCSSTMSAYGEFLDTGKCCYVVREKGDPITIIKEIRKANGVPCLVHPKSLKLNRIDGFDFIKKLKDAGLAAIEVFNPHHTQEQLSFFQSVATELDLIPTVGSDYHGLAKDSIRVGLGIENNLCISDYSIIMALKSKQNEIVRRRK